jgi:methylated-DNA-protein-cysteine methyltransferase related protein
MPRKPARDAQPKSATEIAYARIWDAIERIPRGRVATYGQVAEVAGYVRRPRLTAQALRHVPDGREVPWFRVINAQGRIAIPAGTRGHREQLRRLQAEGVKFVNGRVDLASYRWRPRSEAPLID